MATIKPILDKRKQLVSGEYSLKIRITEKGKQIYIPTGISLFDNQLYNGEIIEHPRSEKYNRLIKDLVSQIKNTISDIIIDKEEMSTENIKSRLNADKIEEEVILFYDMFNQHIKNLNPRTKNVYVQTLSRLERFYGQKIKTIEITKINKQFLENYNSWMIEQGMASSTRSIELRNIRAIYNYAINNEKISAGFYPFRGFKMPKSQPAKRALTIEQLRAIIKADVPEHINKYRDFFLLSFFMCGMNAIDLLHLKHDDIRLGNRIEIKRMKTGQLIQMNIQPEALEIIKRYKGEKYLLDILDRYTNYLDYVRRLDKYIKLITDSSGNQICKNLSIYWARHTWATIASYLDIPEKTIGAALSHADNSVTAMYIDYNAKKIDEANRKVIDFVLNL